MHAGLQGSRLLRYLNPDFWCEPECPIGYYKAVAGEVRGSPRVDFI